MTGPRTRQVPAYEADMWCERRHPAVVVIPVINEGDRIRNLVQRMHALGISDIADVLLVDGGSRDGSLERAYHEPRGVRGILRKTGPGKLSAQLRCGYACALEAGYEHIVTIDGNDKDDPAAIPGFVRDLAAGFDFIQASRYLPGGVAENTPWVRDAAIRLLHAPLLSLASGFRWTDTTQGFRGYSARMLADERVAPFRDCFVSYELLVYLSYRAPRLGYRCIERPTARRYPPGKVPTKISAFRGNLSLLWVLFRACTGGYNP